MIIHNVKKKDVKQYLLEQGVDIEKANIKAIETFNDLIIEKGIERYVQIDSIDEGVKDENGITPESGLIVADNGKVYSFGFYRKDSGQYYFSYFNEEKEVINKEKHVYFYEKYQKALELLKK